MSSTLVLPLTFANMSPTNCYSRMHAVAKIPSMIIQGRKNAKCILPIRAIHLNWARCAIPVHSCKFCDGLGFAPSIARYSPENKTMVERPVIQDEMVRHERSERASRGGSINRELETHYRSMFGTRISWFLESLEYVY